MKILTEILRNYETPFADNLTTFGPREEETLYYESVQEIGYFAPETDPILFYEDVRLGPGETFIGPAGEYGFDPDDWREI